MDKNWSFINKRVKLLISSLIVGSLITGCGGGGGTSTGAVVSTAVGSYIADQQPGKFVGSWVYTGGASSVANASESTLAATGTANTYTFSSADMQLSNGIWGITQNPWLVYSLNTTGWVVSPSTGTLVDSGNGSNVTYTPTGESAIGISIRRTSLEGTPIVCASPTTRATVACAVPSNYPPGAASYQLRSSALSDRYSLVGSAGSISWLPITDATGVALTALPAVGTTFCDPNFRYVFQAIAPVPAVGSNNYNVFGTVSCLAADIAAAIATPGIGTVLISNQATGNANVPNVLRVQATAGTSLVWMNDAVYGLRAGNVWYGWMYPAGLGYNSTEKNKTAINAELLASGLPALL